MSAAAQAILKQAPVVPVITIRDINTAVPLAQTLVAGGLPVLEITLRTPEGLAAIRLIRHEVEGAVVGAGTVLGQGDLDAALQAGSEFIVTPGLTDNLLRAGAACGVPFIPGVATVSELMVCLEQGLDTLKFFPAEAVGGAAALKAFGGPFPQVRFCPTGGIGPANIHQYLALASVLSVGGSWLTPDDLVARGDWAAILRLAREACALVTTLNVEGRGSLP